jgi:large subunit ribosomal protein L3
MKFILGKKIGMSQIFEEGNQIPVTLIEAGPCQVLQIKTKEKDGYTAVQVGFEKIEKEKKIKKPLQKKPFKYLREFRLDESEIKNYELGKKIDVTIFKEGDLISVSGISKGKGFAGGIKRWGFHGRPATHGTKHEERTLGSTGASTPAHVVRGRKMPGRAGGERVTIKNLKIVKIAPENNLIAVKGAVPGRKGTLLEIKSEK